MLGVRVRSYCARQFVVDHQIQRSGLASFSASDGRGRNGDGTSGSSSPHFARGGSD